MVLVYCTLVEQVALGRLCLLSKMAHYFEVSRPKNVGFFTFRGTEVSWKHDIQT